MNLDRSGYTYAISNTTNHLVGNQFVFIPCNTSSYTKTNWGTSYQNVNWDNTTSGSELTQIEKYGGFYSARFEAGFATTMTEFTTAQYHNGSNQIYNSSGVPQSKAEQLPWNFIDWTNAKINAEKMYKTDYVSSGLITGTQWDVILNTLLSKSVLISSDITNSVNWGNYANDTLSFSGLYSAFTSSAYQYPFGNTSVTGSNLYKTGESASAMKYGISDIAGNLWELTEECSLYSASSQYRIVRGGGYINSTSTYTSCYRGNFGMNNTSPDVGFRVVLYMK